MANIKSAIKRARQNVKRNALKSTQRSTARTAVKAVESAVSANDKELAKGAFKNAESALDNLANKKVIHKNKAARIKSRLSKKVKTL